MPVLPAVPSTTVPPGLSAPRRSASSTMPRAARSLTEPPGFMNSALPKISQPVCSLICRSRISGVCPTASTKSCTIFMRSRYPYPSMISWHCRAKRACLATSPTISSAGASICAARARASIWLSGAARTPLRRQRRPLDNDRGPVARGAVRLQPLDDARQLRHAHVEHHRLQRCGQRAPIEPLGPLAHRGDERHRLRQAPLRQRQADTGGRAQRRSDARHDDYRHAGAPQYLDLLAAAAEDERIAALEACHPQSAACVLAAAGRECAPA